VVSLGEEDKEWIGMEREGRISCEEDDVEQEKVVAVGVGDGEEGTEEDDGIEEERQEEDTDGGSVVEKKRLLSS